MSWEASAWALQQSVGHPSGKLVLLTLSNYADTVGSLYWSQGELSEQMEIGENTLRERLNDLERDEFIARFKQERDDGGYTVDLIVVLHDDAAREFAAWLVANSEPETRGDQIFRVINFNLAKSYRRPKRTAAAARRASSKIEDTPHPQKLRMPSAPGGTTLPVAVVEPKEPKPNQSIESCEHHGERGDRGDAQSSLAGKQDEKNCSDAEPLRAACIAAAEGQSIDRVFVDHGSHAFKAWTKTYKELGLVGPSWGKRMIPNGNDAGCGYSRRDGNYFPSKWPPGEARAGAPP